MLTAYLFFSQIKSEAVRNVYFSFSHSADAILKM